MKRAVGRPSKASFVGANTVRGPSVERRSIKSASFNMETKIEKSLLKTRRSRTEHSSWQTEGGTAADRLGG